MFTFEMIAQHLRGTVDSRDVPYIQAYPHFIDFFSNLDVIDHQSLVIGAHAAYGWMPRILKLRKQTDGFQDAIALLNYARDGNILDEQELFTLRKSINNSMVGTSKLLHFINPHQYAIWDSNVYRCWTEGKISTRISYPSEYLKYLKNCEDVASNNAFRRINKTVNRYMGYEVSHLRAIEWIAYCAGRN